MDFNNVLIIFGTAFRKDEKLSENKEKNVFSCISKISMKMSFHGQI